MRERAIHVLDLERDTLPSLAQFRRPRRNGAFLLRESHHLERGAADIQIDQIERPERRRRYTHALPHTEAERLGIELHCAVGLGREQLDVVDTLEQVFICWRSAPSGCARTGCAAAGCKAARPPTPVACP